MKPTHYIDDPENSLNIIIFELSTCRLCGEIDLNEGGTVSMPEFSAMGLDLQQYEPGVLPPSTCPNCVNRETLTWQFFCLVGSQTVNLHPKVHH